MSKYIGKTWTHNIKKIWLVSFAISVRSVESLSSSFFSHNTVHSYGFNLPPGWCALSRPLGTQASALFLCAYREEDEGNTTQAKGTLTPGSPPDVSLRVIFRGHLSVPFLPLATEQRVAHGHPHGVRRSGSSGDCSRVGTKA